MKYINDNWRITRERIYLSLLAIEIILRVVDISIVSYQKSVIGGYILSFEVFWIPVMLGVLYAADIIIENGVTGIFKSYKKLCLDVFIGIFFIIVAYKSYSFHLLAIGAFIFTADKSSMKNIAKVIAVCLGVTTIFIMILSQIGILEDILIYDRFGRVAHSFGFLHYGFFPRQLLFAWLAYLYGKDKKESWPMLVAQLVLIFVIFYFTTQRLTFIVFIISWIMYIIFVKCEFIKVNSIFMKVCSLIGFAVTGCISILLSYFYNPDIAWMNKINSLITGRLYLGKIAFDRYSIPLLGQHIVYSTGENGESFFVIDCGYIEMLLCYGLILFIIIMLMYSIIHLYACFKNQSMLFVWATAVMIETTVDNAWNELSAAATLLLLFGCISKEFINSIEKTSYDKLL